MTLSERIKQECKKQGIPVSKLEKDLGFANAYISQLNPDTVQYHRLVKIADYLHVSEQYLLTGEENAGYYYNEETAKIAQEIFENPELHALFDAARDSDPEELKAFHNMLIVMKRKERNED